MKAKRRPKSHIARGAADRSKGPAHVRAHVTGGDAPTLADAILASFSVDDAHDDDFAAPEWSEHFQAIADDTGLFVGLSPAQQAACLSQLQKECGQFFQANDALRVWAARKAVVTRGPARWRRFDRQSTRAIAAIDELVKRAHLDGIGVEQAERLRTAAADILGSGTKLISKGNRAIAEQRLALNTGKPPADHQFRMWTPVFDFLVQRCGLPKNEAENRIVKLGRRLLAQQLKFRECYERGPAVGFLGEIDKWKGSDGLRKRISRSRRSTPDKPTKNR